MTSVWSSIIFLMVFMFTNRVHFNLGYEAAVMLKKSIHIYII